MPISMCQYFKYVFRLLRRKGPLSVWLEKIDAKVRQVVPSNFRQAAVDTIVITNKDGMNG